jgi:peptidylamidoglycolate lyase
VADRGNSRVQVFDHQGAFISEWKGEHLGRPYGIAVTHNEEVFIIDGGDQPDKTRSRVIVLNAEGNVLDHFSAQHDTDEKNLGHDIAIGDDGAVYVVDTWAHRVRKYMKQN